MSGSKYEYVKTYEKADNLLPNTYLLLRVDGHAFHKFSDAHAFKKPNDPRALELMDRAAQAVMNEYQDVVLGFGESDEYSFLIRRGSNLYSRRESKITTLLLSLFTSAYTYYWSDYFPPNDEEPEGKKLLYPPSFDARVVCYPSEKEIRDYFSWRQVDTHINNLYNTSFWALVQLSDPPLSTTQAHEVLSGTYSKDKNEILFSRFGINYGKLPERYKKGSVLVRQEDEFVLKEDTLKLAGLSLEGVSAVLEDSSSSTSDPSSMSPSATAPENDPVSGPSKPPAKFRNRKKDRPRPPQDGTRGHVVVLHVDIIKDGFWKDRPWLLA